MIDTTASSEKPAEASRWLLLLPRMAFALFVAAVVALLMLSDRSEKDEQRAILISDVLWLEQNLRFQLTRHEEILGQIGLAQVSDPSIFEAHAKTLMASKTGLRQVIWVDASGRIRRNYPGPTDAYMVGEVQDVVPSRETMRLARSLGRPAYSPAYPIIDDDWQFELHVPIFTNGQFSGVSVGAYSVRRILEESIPWWLAERYRIGVIDTAGSTLASRSKVAATDDGSGYQIPFDPPGHGLSLLAVPYRIPTPLVGRLLSSALVILALVVLWSFWALRQHMLQRQAAEEALRNEYAFRKAMEDSLQTGLRARDLEGRITYVNPAFCRMVGWSQQELLGRAPPMPYWPDEYLDETQEIHDRILAGQGDEEGIEVKLKRRSGELFDALIHEAPLIDARGRHAGWMGSLIDITEHRRAEELATQQRERLQATARLVAMGEMASSLAHELNQPLAAIASYNTGCINMLDSGEGHLGDIRIALAKSAEQAQRAGRIVRRIYEFVRRAEPKSESCDLTEIIEEVLGLVEADARRQKIRLNREIERPLPLIQGDRVLIAQALFNLIRNGMESMRGIAGDQTALTVSATSDIDSIALAVADRGCGVAPNAQAKLFEPFYTTKAEGMGMGLNICRSVIEAHHGRLWYEPNPQGGSIFRVRFPVAPT